MKTRKLVKAVKGLLGMLIGLGLMASQTALAAPSSGAAAPLPARTQSLPLSLLPTLQSVKVSDFNLQDPASLQRTRSMQWGLMDSDRYQLALINDDLADGGLYAQILGRSFLGKDNVLQGSRLFFSLGYRNSLVGILGRLSLSNSMKCQDCFLTQDKQQQYGLGVFVHQEGRYVFARAMLSANWFYAPDLLRRVVKRVSEQSDDATENKAVAKSLIKNFKLQNNFDYNLTASFGAHAYLPLNLRLSPEFLLQYGGLQESGNRTSTLKTGVYLSLGHFEPQYLQIDAQVGMAYVFHLSNSVRLSSLPDWIRDGNKNGFPKHDDLEYSLRFRAQVRPLDNLNVGLFLGYDGYQSAAIKQLIYGGNLALVF